MAVHLLITKLLIPPPRPNLVPRPRLIQRLAEGLDLGRKLTLISAPAGFGKTALISEWLGALTSSPRPPAAGTPLPLSRGAGEGEGGRGVGVRATWLSLDEGDNDPVRFLTYLIAALQAIDAGIGRDVQGLLATPQLPPPESLLALLINDIAALADPVVLVLDDYQAVSAPLIHNAVEFLLEHQPPKAHLVLVTREDPPLPLARLRARGQVTEIRERDLRFTVEEAGLFLRQTMGLRLSDETVRLLVLRTEGWITGLQLAALAFQEKHEDTSTFIYAFSGDNRYVMDYLVAEVLQRQPEMVRTFLRQTAFLDRLTAPLCDAVTGRDDSQAILEQLEGTNLFLIPLDHRREWYRYHRLFAEVLRATLPPEEQTLLHRRALAWYEAHGLVNQAIQHALAYTAVSGDTGEIERLVLTAAEETFLSGAVQTVHGWLEALPEARVRANWELATYKGWVLAANGEMALAEDYAVAAESEAGRLGVPAAGLGKLRALRAFLALLGRRSYAEAIDLASDALRALPEGQAHWRIIAFWVLAESQERTTDIAAAIDTLREACRAGRASANQLFAALVEDFLATALNNHGRRREAITVCEEAIARYADDAGRMSPVAGAILGQMGVLHYEANQLDLARRCLDKGLALSEQLALTGLLTPAYGFSALILQAQGETGAALETLQKACQLTAHTGFTDAGWLQAFETNIRLQQGDLPFALRWAEAAGLSPADAPDYMLLDQQLAYGRLLLAQRRFADVGRWLAGLERFARERGLRRCLLTVHLLQALAAEVTGDRPAARGCLSRALEIAAPQDYYRAFLDEGERIIALLPEVRRAAPAFVDQLLEFAGVPRRPLRIAQPLVEPLSERELEVLALIAAGLGNAGIAARLVISVGTVKRHINHIYGKLGVGSRTQAIAKARSLRLLEERP